MQSGRPSIEAPGRQEEEVDGREEWNHHPNGRDDQTEHPKPHQEGIPEALPQRTALLRLWPAASLIVALL